MTFAWIAGSFVVALALSYGIGGNPARIGCLLPVMTAGAAMAYLVVLQLRGAHVGSTAPVGVMVVMALVACGSVPGSVVGRALRKAGGL